MELNYKIKGKKHKLRNKGNTDGPFSFGERVTTRWVSLKSL
jgi:hypothetical protein